MAYVFSANQRGYENQYRRESASINASAERETNHCDVNISHSAMKHYKMASLIILKLAMADSSVQM